MNLFLSTILFIHETLSIENIVDIFTNKFYVFSAETSSLHPKLIVSGVVGGIIILTLADVSYRKYKGEQQMKREREEKEVRRRN